MKLIWNACKTASITIPTEVWDFFDGEDPGDKPGAEISIKGAVRSWQDKEREGYELDVTKVPDDVKIIRFYNSY
jgi:hypothetical protein